VCVCTPVQALICPFKSNFEKVSSPFGIPKSTILFESLSHTTSEKAWFNSGVPCTMQFSVRENLGADMETGK